MSPRHRILTVCLGGLAGLSLGLSSSALANYELRTLYRDTRMKAMGGAGVALTLDDRDALQGIFTNPAMMAGNRDITFHYLTADIGASWESYTAIGDVSSAFSNFTMDSLNSILGKNIFGNLQLAGGVTGPGFGVAALMDGQVAFYGQNQAYPDFTVAYQTTTGVQAAWGMAIDMTPGASGRRRPRKQNAGKAGGNLSELRLGLGGKLLWRRGGYKNVPLSTLLSANIDTLKALMGSYETGYGADAGLQYVRSIGGAVTWSLGASFQNIGDLDFRRTVADTIPGNLTAGGSLKYSLGGITSATLAYDQAFLTTDTDWRKRSRFGVEWVLPGVSVYGGLHQTYLSYGASFDAWLFRITAASYAEELGGTADQNGNRRYVLRLAMRLGL